MILAGAARWVRRNRVSCVLLIAIAAALYWKPLGDSPAPEPEAPPAEAVAETAQEAEQRALDQALKDTIYRQRVRERERSTAKSEIAAHLELLEKEVEPYEYASRLCALGNLYQQKEGDYATAAGYYELLIEQHSDWPGIQTAYHQLIACYKRLGDTQKLRLLYRRMLEHFPEGTTEHAYALAALEP